MILPDINLLIYAHNPHSPDHQAALDWWNHSLAGPKPVALPWLVILGFLRLSTKKGIFPNPMPMPDAIARIDSWVTRPHFHIIEPGPRHLAILAELLQSGATGDLTSDAHLAAIAIERGITVHSSDADFARFPGLSWVNPLLP